jgi:hypothetical protein
VATTDLSQQFFDELEVSPAGEFPTLDEYTRALAATQRAPTPPSEQPQVRQPMPERYAQSYRIWSKERRRRFERLATPYTVVNMATSEPMPLDEPTTPSDFGVTT